MQPAFVYSSGISPRDVSATSRFGVDTTVPSTGDSSLLSARTTSGPLLMGPAASVAGGFWVGVNALGLTYSEASGPPNFWTELCGTPSTTCVLLWPDHLGVISLQHACCSGKGKPPSQHPAHIWFQLESKHLESP